MTDAVSIGQVITIAGGIVAAETTAIIVLWRALHTSQEARISQSDRHAKDMETIISELKRKKGA